MDNKILNKEKATQYLDEIWKFVVSDDFKPMFTNVEQAIEYYYTQNISFSTLKQLDRNANILDFGAGSGGMKNFLQWNAPIREDLNLYGVDLSKGDFFDFLAGFYIGDITKGNHPKDWENKFDYIFSRHVIEHLENMDDFLDLIEKLSSENAKIYIEWPTVESQFFPTRNYIKEKYDIDVTTINFFDDPTHVSNCHYTQLVKKINSRGLFTVYYNEIIKNEFLGEQLLGIGLRENNSHAMSMGLWVLLGFSQALLLQKTEFSTLKNIHEENKENL